MLRAAAAAADRVTTMTSDDQYSNPLARKKPLGGSVGVAVVAITPVIALALFLILGLTIGAWGWAWIFFLAVPVVGWVVYGLGPRGAGS